MNENNDNNIILNDVGWQNFIIDPNVGNSISPLDGSLLPNTPTPTNSVTPTPFVTPSSTFTPTITPTLTPTATVTPTPSITISPTLSPVVNTGNYATYNVLPGANVWYVNTKELAILQGVCQQVKIKIYYVYSGPYSIKSLQTDISVLIYFPEIAETKWHNAINVFPSPAEAFAFISTLYATNTMITPTPSVSPTLNIPEYFSEVAAPTAPSGVFGIDYVNGEYFDGFYGDYGVSIEGIDVYIGTWYE